MKEIRELAERVIVAQDDYERGSIHPVAAPADSEVALARFALAVLDALDEECDHYAAGHFAGPTTVRNNIERRMKEHK